MKANITTEVSYHSYDEVRMSGEDFIKLFKDFEENDDFSLYSIGPTFEFEKEKNIGKLISVTFSSFDGMEKFFKEKGVELIDNRVYSPALDTMKTLLNSIRNDIISNNLNTETLLVELNNVLEGGK